jgi:hypothetical protein
MLPRSNSPRIAPLVGVGAGGVIDAFGVKVEDGVEGIGDRVGDGIGVGVGVGVGEKDDCPLPPQAATIAAVPIRNANNNCLARLRWPRFPLTIQVKARRYMPAWLLITAYCSLHDLAAQACHPVLTVISKYGNRAELRSAIALA